MLSLFPQFLFLSPFAALAIRVTLALYFAFAAWQHMAQRGSMPRVASAFELAIAAALLAGAWVQAVALLGLVDAAMSLVYPQIRVYPVSTIVLGSVMLATLVVTGAGAFAFDLPL